MEDPSGCGRGREKATLLPSCCQRAHVCRSDPSYATLLTHLHLRLHLHLHLLNHSSDSYATGGLDIPIDRPLIKRDWRFGHYETEGLQDPISKLVRLAITICTFGLLKRKGQKGGKKAEKDTRALQNSGHQLPSGPRSAGGKMDQDLVMALALEK